MASGFYVPGSLSSSYVQSKRNEQGSLEYDSKQNEIGITEQAAIQDLQSQYESTIENAYAAYVANQRNIAMSNMGQGYKEIYAGLAQQNMQSTIGEARTNLQSVRSEIEGQTDAMRQSLQQQFEGEVVNLDRVASSFEGYRQYLAGLTSKDPKNEEGIFTKEESALGIDELYERLANEFSQRAKNYTDPDTELSGMSYAEWISNQYGSKDTDKDWYQWFLTGGYQDFMRSVTKRNQPSALEAQRTVDKAAQLEQLEALKKAYEDAEKEFNRVRNARGNRGRGQTYKLYAPNSEKYKNAEAAYNKAKEVYENYKSSMEG